MSFTNMLNKILTHSWTNTNQRRASNWLNALLFDQFKVAEIFEGKYFYGILWSPLKQKLNQNNNHPFMTKTLRKAIMKRSKLRNKFSEERNIENWSEYKQQRTFVQIY